MKDCHGRLYRGVIVYIDATQRESYERATCAVKGVL